MSDDRGRSEFTIEVEQPAEAYRSISSDPRAFGVLMRTVLLGSTTPSWDDARHQLRDHYGVVITSTRTVFK